MALGFLLLLLGGVSVGSSLAFAQQRQVGLGWLALLLGLVTLAQGIWLVGRQERRRDDMPGRHRARG